MDSIANALVISATSVVGIGMLGVAGCLHRNKKGKANQHQMAGTNRKRNLCPPRVVASALAIALGYFLFLQARSAWTNYWLLKDGQEGVALVTGEAWSGHNVVIYNYTVNLKQYTGRSMRNWEEAKYRNVEIGDESVVCFSASHPWLSLLYKPSAVFAGLPVLVIVLVIELFAVFTIIKPQSGWALNLRDEGEKRAG